ncbi:MAG: hypothetical protein ACRDCW_18200 [Sarcina sp.]
MNKLGLCNNALVADPVNNFLSIQVANNARFNSGSVIPGNNYGISFNWPNAPGTSYTTIRIDGINYIYGEDGIQVLPPTDISPLLNKSAWQIGDILVEQYLEIVSNPYTGRMDMGRYSYVLTNISESEFNHYVGVRIMIDTMVDGDDGPDLIIPGLGILANETEFIRNIPEYWQGMSKNFLDPTKKSLGILSYQGEVIPDKVIFATWSHLNVNQWDYVVDPFLSIFTDNAIAVYWEEKYLGIGESMEVATRYGLSPETSIPFRDSVSLSTETVKCTSDLAKNIEITAEIKVFASKYAHSEADCIRDGKIGKGDDLGFTLVFGNYGELNYIANPLEPTVEDTLMVQSPIDLKLMSLCKCDNFILFNLNTNTKVEICDVFKGGSVYRLQVRKLKVGGNPNNIEDYVAEFDIPCHTIYCMSMLFQVEFPPCVSCPPRQ